MPETGNFGQPSTQLRHWVLERDFIVLERPTKRRHVPLGNGGRYFGYVGHAGGIATWSGGRGLIEVNPTITVATHFISFN